MCKSSVSFYFFNVWRCAVWLASLCFWFFRTGLGLTLDKRRALWRIPWNFKWETREFKPLHVHAAEELIVSSKCSEVFLANKGLNLAARQALFISRSRHPFIFLFSCLFHLFRAQPHKLTDSHKGHSVIRWKQYPSRSGPAAFSLIFMLLPSHMHVINTTASALRRCLQHAGTWLPSLSVHGPHLLLLHISRCYKRDVCHILQHICRIENTKCCLIFVFVWRSSKT